MRRLLFSPHRLPLMFGARAAGAAAARHPALSSLFCVLRGGNTVRCYSAAVTAGGCPTHKFFVQGPGAKSSFPIVARDDMLVGFLVEEIQKKLPSLRDVSLDSIILQLASEDGTLLTAQGTQTPVTLNSMDTVDEALEKAAKAAGRTIERKDKLRIIVNVSAPAVPGASAGALTPHKYSNVLTSPAAACEVLDKHAVAVETFADSTQSWPARLAALNEISEALLEHAPSSLFEGIALPLLDTKSHLEVLAAFVRSAEGLQAGSYKGLNGVACRMLLGAHGIGKTNLALAFTYACSKGFPSIIPLYVTGAELDKDSCFHDMDLKSLMIATARAHGVAVDESMGAFRLNDALKRAGKRMLIIVDEVDELYRLGNSEPKLQENAMDTLRYLQELGNRKSGLYAVLLCGSSAFTSGLLFKGVAEHMLHRFPLFHGSPDLERTKFPALLIPAALGTATEQVERIVIALGRVPADEHKHQELMPPRKSLQLARLLTFFVGTTPRAITSALEPTMDGVLSAARLQRLVTAQLVPDLPTGDVESHARVFFLELLRLLQNSNSEVRDMLCVPGGTVNTRAVMMESWEGAVKPLKWEQVQQAWSELAKSKQLPDPSYVYTLVSILCDASLVSLRPDPGTLGYCVWPASAAQLVYSYEDAPVAGLLEDAARELQPLMRAVRPVEPPVKVVRPLAEAALETGAL